MTKNRRILRTCILTTFIFTVTFLILRRPSPRVQIYGLTLNLYQDGSQHPLTSYMESKLEYFYKRQILQKNDTSWKWQPEGLSDKVLEYASHISLTVDPPIVDNGGVVTIHWENSDPDIRLDVLALYCPSGAPSKRFIDYWHLATKELYCPNCSDKRGSVRLALFNVRVSCEFRLFYVRGEDKVDLVAVSNLVDFTDGKDAPLHGHLALTGDPTQMRVQWTSGRTNTPVVYYGQSRSDLSHSASGTWRTYTQEDLCGPPANQSMYFLHPGYLHDVLLENLRLNTLYFYKYGATEGSKFSPIKTFTTPPSHGAGDTFKFAIYGDMDITAHPGAESTASLLLREAIENDLSFVLHIGDISYSEGLSYRWDEWMTLIEPYSSLVPYMVSVGNHDQVTAVGSEKNPSGDSLVRQLDSDHDSQGECGVPLDRRFHMPDDGNRLWWYSFKYGAMHIIQLSCEHDTRPGAEQYRWLEANLRSMDRGVTPWLVVTCHRPMYSSVGVKSDYIVGRTIRTNIEDLLSQHNVDLFIAGHYHAYERTCKVYRAECDRVKGIVNVVVGTGGMELDEVDLWTLGWSKHAEFSFGYGRATVNRTDLLWEFVRNEDQVVSDAVRLKK